MSDEDDDDSVGYGRPPKAHQFKKGQSGNRNGRPRKAKPARRLSTSTRLTSELIASESERIIEVRENGKVVKLPLSQALVRGLNVAALKGTPRDRIDALKLLRTATQFLDDDWSLIVANVTDYKRYWAEQFAACDAASRPRPEPAPHPDEVYIDHQNRLIFHNGPQDEAEKAAWTRAREWRDDCEWEINSILEHAKQTGTAVAAHLYKLLSVDKASVEVMDGLFPDEKTRRAPGFILGLWRAKNGVVAKLDKEGFKAFIVPWDGEAWPRRAIRM